MWIHFVMKIYLRYFFIMLLQSVCVLAIYLFSEYKHIYIYIYIMSIIMLKTYMMSFTLN